MKLFVLPYLGSHVNMEKGLVTLGNIFICRVSSLDFQYINHVHWPKKNSTEWLKCSILESESFYGV